MPQPSGREQVATGSRQGGRVDKALCLEELQHLLATLQDKIRESPRHYQYLWEEILQQGVTRGDLRSDLDIQAMVFMIMGMCNWLHRWYRKGGRLDTDTLATQYASAMLEGIVLREGPERGRALTRPCPAGLRVNGAKQ